MRRGNAWQLNANEGKHPGKNLLEESFQKYSKRRAMVGQMCRDQNLFAHPYKGQGKDL